MGISPSTQAVASTLLDYWGAILLLAAMEIYHSPTLKSAAITIPMYQVQLVVILM